MNTQATDFFIVGVGASAGGLAALKAFLRPLRKTGRLAYIIVQHLDPNHKSLLTELLTRECQLELVDAQDGMTLSADTVYIISPSTLLEVEGHKLKVTQQKPTHGTRRTVDRLFDSIARARDKWCAGIVLSGSGSDGTAGLKSIKDTEGLTLAQDPDTAEHASMPLHAIDANTVDMVLAPEKMFDILNSYTDSSQREPVFESRGEVKRREALSEIGSILKLHHGFDLRQYKLPTVQRRIARRMSLTDTSSLPSYTQKLKDSEDERIQLTQDLLVNVTHFFRDNEAFELLESIASDTIVSLEPDEEIRLWVAGCASGEEAYSLAIIFTEELKKHERSNRLKIFATDIDQHAISKARQGIYSEGSVEAIPQHRLKQYFAYDKKTDTYKVISSIRNSISFAHHNLANDPPFGHMHLISCRNVLIYLNKTVQDRILSSFYYALEADGHLFLGSSESLGSSNQGFKSISKKWRIFKKSKDQNSKNKFLNHLKSQNIKNRARDDSKETNSGNLKSSGSEASTRGTKMRNALLNTFMPPSAIIDGEGEIFYTHGDWKPYFAVRSGEPTHNLLQLLLPALRTKMRSALYKVRRTQESVEFKAELDLNAAHKERHQKVLKVQIAPLNRLDFAHENTYGIALTSEEKISKAANKLTVDDEIHDRLNIERELIATREELQNAIEELETNKEELTASHEEALSTNEELQSANEELEASSEELRSLNEELSTVNAQLKDKLELLQKANDDVENFVASTNVPTIFLDSKLNIKRFTPSAEHLLRMGPQDIGRNISSIGRELVDTELESECHQVMTTLQPIRTEKCSEKGEWYVRQVSPYRTESRNVNGVVIVFQDITEIKTLSRRAQLREQQQATVASLGMYALGSSDPDSLMQQVVRKAVRILDADFCKILKYRPETKDFLLVAGIGWQDGLVGKATVPGGQDSQAGFTYASKEPVVVDDLQAEKRFTGAQLLMDHGVTSGLSCLINHDSPAFGVIGVHSTRRRAFTEDDANFLLSIANLLSIALRMKRTQEQIHQHEEQFRSLANSIPQLAWMTDKTGAILWYNQRWYDFTGTDFESTKGWGWHSVHHPDHLERVVKKFKRSISSGEHWEDEFPLRGSSGEYRWFLSRAEPIKDNNGEVVRWFGTNTDITEKLEQANALSESESKLRLAIESNKIASFEYSLQEENTYWDPMIREIWGLTDQQTPTQELFWEGIHPEDAKTVNASLEAAMNPDLDGRYHCVYRVVNLQTKSTTWVEASGQVLFDEQEKPLKMIGMVIDISERKALESTLRQAVEELQKADQSKNEFLSILGHELRNPLAALSNSVEILTRHEPEDVDVVRVMKHSVTTMARLLDDLLDLNRVSQNKIELTQEPVNLSSILKHVIDSVKSTCDKKQQHLSAELIDHVYVNGDAGRLEQTFTNIVLNSCRYTPIGGVIEISVAEVNSEIEIRIKDNGVGIEPEHLHKIFDPFFQIKQNEKAASGLGIGLALSKNLITLHGGEIFAHSTGPGHGAEFFVKLPVCEPVQDQSEATATDSNNSIDGLKVLVVEDNEHILETIPILLTSLGCVVEVVDSGLKSISKVSEFKPDVMLVDIGLPDISGHQVAERIRAEGYKGFMVAVSGYSHKEARDTSKSVGFDEHLAKPITLSEISEILSRANHREDS